MNRTIGTQVGGAPSVSDSDAYAGFVIRWFGALLAAAASVAVPVVASAQEDPAPPPGRQPLIEVPPGCPIAPLPDVVFVGTVVDTDFRTGRYHVDQVRAGDMSQFISGEHVDVRYGIDTKYLREGDQYLIGASYDPNIQTLRSRVRPEAPTFGGDEIIGATERDLQCPDVVDSMRTMHTDGTSIESGIASPFFNDREGLLRSLLVPVAIVSGAIFALAAIRWILTGFGRGVESIARTSAQSREARSGIRARQAAPAAGPAMRARSDGRPSRGQLPPRQGQTRQPPGRRR